MKEKILFVISLMIVIPLLIFGAELLTIENNETISGEYTMSGDFTDLDNVDTVKVKINDGDWETIADSEYWSYDLNYRNINVQIERRVDALTGDVYIITRRGPLYGDCKIVIGAFDAYDSILREEVHNVTIIPESPTANVENGYYAEDVDIELTTHPELTMYYTLDGTTPDEYSELYTEVLTVSETTQIHAVAISESGISSDPMVLDIVIDRSGKPTFTTEYFADGTMMESLGETPALKEGTYYLKITANKKLQAIPTISIDAPGTLNDITDVPAYWISGNTYYIERTIIADGSGAGEGEEVITISGIDMVGNEAVNDSPVNASGIAQIDTVAPEAGTIEVATNYGYVCTTKPVITLECADAAYMRFAQGENELSTMEWVEYQTPYSSFEIITADTGPVTIWVEFMDKAGNITESASFDTVMYDTDCLSFNMQYYSSYNSDTKEFSGALGDNPYLKAGTYYLQVTASKELADTPYISIDAEGEANDVDAQVLDAVAGETYLLTRTITTDAQAIGQDLEQITLNSNEVPAALLKAAYTDTEAPVVQAGDDVNWTNSTVSLNATVADENLADMAWEKTSGAGILTISNDLIADPTVSGEQDIEQAYVLTLTAVDKAGNTASDTLTLKWDTRAPVVDAGVDIDFTDGVIELAGQADDDNGITDVVWTSDNAEDVIFGDSSSLTGTITGKDGGEGAYTITLTATDTAGNNSTDTLTFNWDKKAPVVALGDDIDWTNTAVALTPAVTEVFVASYYWEQVSGADTVTFSSTTDKDISVEGPANAEGTYVIKLTVTDEQGNTGSDTLTLNWDTIVPVVDAGAEIAWRNTAVEVAATTDEVDNYTVAWTKTTGEGDITFTDASALTTTIQGANDACDSYTISVSVIDKAGNEGTDTLTFNWDKKGPTVNAGDDIDFTNVSANLSGSVSDVNGITDTVWAKTGGNGTVTIGDVSVLSTTIVGQADTEESYTITLTASDTLGNSASDTVTFNWDAKTPVVDAGADTGLVNSAAALSATVTEANIASYLWEKTAGTGTLTFSAADSNDTTVSGPADTEETYTIQLTVTDAAGNAAADTLTLDWDSKVPVVNAGDDIGLTNETTSLAGTATDGNTIVSYLWEDVSVEAGAIFSSTDTASTTVWAADKTNGTYTLKLTAVDAAGNSNSDTLVFNWDARDLVVNAGDDIAATNQTTQLTATVNTPDRVSSVLWEQTAGTGTVTFGSADQLSTTVTGPDDVEVSYTLKVTVEDDAGNVATDTLTFNWDKKGPAVNAGDDIGWTNEFTTNLSGTVTDTNTYGWAFKNPADDDIASLKNVTTLTPEFNCFKTIEHVFEIELTASDALGNTSSDSVLVKFDLKSPVITLDEMSWTNEAVEMNPTVTDTNEIVKYEWKEHVIPTGYYTEDFSVPVSADMGWENIDSADSWAIHDEGYSGTSGYRSAANPVEYSVISLRRDIPDDSTISFWLLTDSHYDIPNDIFEFYIDGEVVLTCDGVNDWTQHTHFVPAGEHVFTWKYRNAWINEIDSYAWIDDVQFKILMPQVTFSDATIRNPVITGVGEYENTIQLLFTAWDAAGNRNAEFVDFKWDNKAPTVTADDDIDWTDQSHYIGGVLVNPDASGIKSKQWSKTAGEGDITFSHPTDLYTNVIGTDNYQDTYTLQLAYTDNAGNVGSDTMTFKWDAKAPQIDAIHAQEPLHRVNAGYDSTLNAMYFVNENTGWIVGEAGICMKTIDGGVTWTTIDTGYAGDYNSVHFINENTGWISGDNGLILKTTDGGVTWTTLDSGVGTPSLFDFIKIQFVDANNGWLCGSGGTLLKSTNGGATWNEEVQKIVNFNDMYATSSYEVFLVTDSGVILRRFFDTEYTVWSYYTDDIRSIYFLDANTGYAVGAGNTFYKSTDGGRNWTKEVLSGSAKDYISVYFKDANTGWICDSDWTIHTTTDGGATWGYIDYIAGDNFDTSYKQCLTVNDDLFVIATDGLYQSFMCYNETWERTNGKHTFSADITDVSEYTYLWEQVGGSTTLTIEGADTATPAMYGAYAAVETYRVRLTVTDVIGNASSYEFDFDWLDAALIAMKQGDTVIAEHDSVSYGDVNTGGTKDMVFTIVNEGCKELSVTGVTMAAGDISDFDVDTSMMDSTIPGLGSTTFTVAFNPTVVEYKAASLKVSTSDSTNPDFYVMLTGTCVDAPEISVMDDISTVIPSGTGSYDFGETYTLISISKTLSVDNVGTLPLSLTGTPLVDISGTDAACFEVVADPDAQVAGGASSPFTLKFTPDSTGTKTAEVTISNDDSDEGTYTFTVTGSSTDATVLPSLNEWHEFTIAKGEEQWYVVQIPDDEQVVVYIDNEFGSGAYDVGAYVTAYNNDLSVEAISRTANTFSGNRVITNARGAIALKIDRSEYDDTTITNKYAIKVFQGLPPKLSSVKEGTDYYFHEDTYSFGYVDPAAVISKTLTFSNSGEGVLEVGTIVLEGDTTYFSVTQPAVTSLAAGESTEFTITFSPSSTTDRHTVIMKIPSNCPSIEELNIEVTGRGL